MIWYDWRSTWLTWWVWQSQNLRLDGTNSQCGRGWRDWRLTNSIYIYIKYIFIYLIGDWWFTIYNCGLFFPHIYALGLIIKPVCTLGLMVNPIHISLYFQWIGFAGKILTGNHGFYHGLVILNHGVFRFQFSPQNQSVGNFDNLWKIWIQWARSPEEILHTFRQGYLWWYFMMCY